MIEINGLRVHQATQTKIEHKDFTIARDARGNVVVTLGEMDPIELEASEAPAFLAACALLTKKRIGGGRKPGVKNKPAASKPAAKKGAAK